MVLLSSPSAFNRIRQPEGAGDDEKHGRTKNLKIDVKTTDVILSIDLIPKFLIKKVAVVFWLIYDFQRTRE